MAQADVAEPSGLRQRLHWVIAFRLIFASVLVVATFIWRPGVETLQINRPFLVVVGVTAVHLAMATLFFVLFRTLKIRRLKTFAYTQLVYDVIFATSFVSVTGGIESDLKGLYWLTIVLAAILLFRTGAFFVALLSSLLYGVLLNLELFGVVSPIFNSVVETSLGQEDRIWRSVVMQSVGFFTIAYVFSSIAVWLRRAETMLEEKSADLEDLEALMGRIVESLTSGLATLDQQDRISFWSRMAEEITGFQVDTVLGKTVTELFPAGKPFFEKDRELVAQGAQPSRWDISFRHRTGEEKTLGFSLSPLRHGVNGKPGTLLIFQDLTRYREMEDQVKRADRLAAVGELAARIAHEIRNPLTSMSGSIEMLRSNLKLEQKEKRLMDIVVRETDRLNQLLTDFLQFARPMPPQFEDVALDQLLEDASELFTKSHKEVRVHLELKPRISVVGDTRQLNQMFWNLMQNASEAMPSGGDVRIVLNRDDLQKKVVIEVTDKGVGISPDIRDRIFTPFFTTKRKGTGLGLAMVRRIAEDHSGEVSVQSVEGVGTTFRVELPVSQGTVTHG